ncbi:hypothetical protein Vadar_029324 [Vaccinium darrowii]|uniref:Uncharacterized protein n=1 Tax=Vaccinium darrowii TaxID=229202 RepID=A0ACB7ZMN9_9ERIC|nr:hypothetical protein Vadar_029324 [Vaccinium darrowii]
MGGFAFIIILFGNLLLLLLKPCSTLPLCTDSTFPVKANTTLTFCSSYNGTASCCDSAEDLNLQTQFQSMNISNPGCAAIVKSILCAKCDPFSAELFTVKSTARTVPVLCNSTVSANSTQTNQASDNFCAKVWNQCSNVSIMNSPFATGQPSTSKSTELTNFWQSQSGFCNTFGGASLDDSVCYDGAQVTLNNTGTNLSFPSGMCLEQISNGSYMNMVPHPDGSSRAFFANPQGQIWLANIPEQGSGGTIQLESSVPFLDLSNYVYYDTELGLTGIAPHPNFLQNGRFFAAFNCDKASWPGCVGRCSCNSAINCDPSNLPALSGGQPCQYQSVIAEYSANGTTSNISSATSANPTEVRRIFTMGLPFTNHHAGQILFGPADGYLYFMMGDGGGTGDPYNFAQNKKTLLGKIMRFDVDTIPSAAEINQLGLWGNYSIPSDNPYYEDSSLLPEIWALGFRNPWRCSFDSLKPSYFMCGDVGQEVYEEVDLITRGGNYGWRVYEGPYLYTPPTSPGGNTSANSIRGIFPVMGYNHSSVNKQENAASVTGGYFYRSTTDPCMYGSYVYADLYGAAFWAGIENPEDSGIFNQSLMQFTCAADSPIKCTFVNGSSYPTLGYVLSLAEDNNKDIYLITSSGVYRIVAPSRCSYTCSKETVTPSSPSPTSTPSSRTSRLSLRENAILLCASLVLILLGFF